jgi:hypothetical protein
VITQGFKVLTEFRFDIASAVASSQTLQSEVGKISSAADQAHFALKRVGIGLAYQMGLGQGGFLGMIYTALKASDKFAASQRSVANILLSSNLFDGAFAFEDAMSSASKAMQNMKQAAREFSLPVQDLVNTSKLIGAVLVNHGLDDAQLTRSTQLARGFLKSAPVLGIDPGLAQGQLLDAVMGRANMGDTFMQRLMNETEAMKQFAPKSGKQQAGGGAALFNALDAAKRLEVLNKALYQFGSNSRILDENTRSLSGQLQRLSDNITGIFSIFKPLGDALSKPVRMVLFKINEYLERDGEKIVANFSGIIKRMFADPEKLFVGIQQARNFSGDVSKAGNMLLLIAVVQGITWALRTLGITLRGGLILSGLRLLGSGIAWLGRAFVSVGGLSFMVKAFAFVLRSIVAPIAILTFMFQIISRAIAKAQVSNAKFLANNVERISALFNRLTVAISNIMLPIEMIIEFWSDLVSWIFRLDLSGNILLGLLEQFIKFMEQLGHAIVFILSTISGIISSLMGMVYQLVEGNFRKVGANIGKDFMDGFNEVYAKRFQRTGMTGDSEGAVSNKITNIDKIEINNQFKEQMEPDRIAFVLKEQLVKAALNPQQSSGRSLRSALVTN